MAKELFNKTVLRQAFNRKRQQLDAVAIKEKSELISQIFFENFDLSKIKYLHIFLSIPEKSEINTQLIIQQIWSEYPHIQLVSSQTDFKNNLLYNYLLNQDTVIKKNVWGIPEPINSIQIADNQLDMILIPLLCFDEKGNRVGYGKGFYDRFLANCRSDALKIGLSLFPPISEIADIDKYDIPLNYCIENQNIWSFDNN